MLLVTDNVTQAKNRLYSSDAFIELIELQMADGTIVRYANNRIDVVWNGETWGKFNFRHGDYEETSDGDLPTVDLFVSNVGRVISGHMESSSNGLIDDTIIYRQVHTDNLDEVTPALEAQYKIEDAQVVGKEWVRFTLGFENPMLQRFPQNVIRRNLCRYKPWQTDACVYAASASCDLSFSSCISLGQTARFGGQPGTPGGAWVVS